MSDKQVIRLLRFALASIWTAIEHDSTPRLDDDCQTIADEALELTINWAAPRDLRFDGESGKVGWEHFKREYIRT